MDQLSPGSLGNPYEPEAPDFPDAPAFDELLLDFLAESDEPEPLDAPFVPVVLLSPELPDAPDAPDVPEGLSLAASAL